MWDDGRINGENPVVTLHHMLSQLASQPTGINFSVKLAATAAQLTKQAKLRFKARVAKRTILSR